MITLQQQRIHWQTIVIVVVAALVLHLVAFAALGWYLLLAKVVGNHDKEEVTPEKLELNVSSLTQLREQLYPTEPLPPLPPLPEEKKKPELKKRKMIDTDGIAAKDEAPKDPSFESDRNTEAASELPPSITSKDKPLPNQKGELFERSPNLKNSKFSEDQKAELSPLVPRDQLDQERLTKKQKQSLKAREQNSQKSDGSLANESLKEEAIDPLVPLPAEPLRPVPEEKNDQTPEGSKDKNTEPKSEQEDNSDKSEAEKKELKDAAKKGDSDREQEAKKRSKPRRKLQSFTSERRRSHMSGSISRNGPSSVAAANTPMGRYWKQICKAVEIEWQREATKHRDFNMPGSLRISFFVDSRGKVSKLRILSAAGVATIQKGYTIRSIRAAKIPTMPAKLRYEMKGEPLEMTITFNY